MSAPARGPQRPAEWLRQQHQVETPEHVELRLELAGVGSRTAAVALDSLIINGVLLLTAIVLSSVFSLDSVAGGWASALLILLFYFAQIIYFVVLEGFWGGRTIGKRALGIRVVMDTGRAVTIGAVAVRNLLRVIDFLFPLAPFIPGILLVLLTKSHKRLGEIQVRTREMHEEAEYGIAAHWRYKEGTRGDRRYDEKLAWVRQLIDWQREVVDATGPGLGTTPSVKGLIACRFRFDQPDA